MKKLLTDIDLFLELYPKSLYCLTAGLLFAVLVGFFGGNVSQEYLSSNSPSMLKQTIAPLLAKFFAGLSLLIVIGALSLAIGQFKKDWKAYRSRF